MDQLLETNFETKKTTGLDVINQFANGQAEFDVIVEGGVKKLRCSGHDGHLPHRRPIRPS